MKPPRHTAEFMFLAAMVLVVLAALFSLLLMGEAH